MVVGLAVMLALVVGIVSPALAAKATNFVVNTTNNATAKSSLVASIADPVLSLVNNGVGPALNLQVPTGKPPMTVSGTGTADETVTNLSADKLDGKDSTQLGVVSTEFNSARLRLGLDGFPLGPPSSAWSFFPRGDGNATVTVANGQLVVVNATASLGAAIGGADDLSLGICSKTGAGAVTLFDTSTYLDDLSMDNYQRLPFTLSEVKTDLPAGEHTVGMCYRGGNGSWNIAENRTLTQVYN